jgi:glycosyltransferase involved in cell wall biosynthesis
MSLIIFSVVVPTHGRVDLLTKTLESLEAQTMGNFEVVVTDDSPREADRAAIVAAVDNYANRTGRPASYHFTTPQLGQARNTNQGLRVVRGQFVRILHSDDLLAPGALACETRLLQDSRLNIEVLIHKVETFVSCPRHDGTAQPSLVQPKCYFRSVMHSSTPVPSGLAFTKEALDAVGLMREDLDFLCDWEFVARLVLREHSAYRFLLEISPGLVGWRIHLNSTTGRLWHRHFLEHELYIDEYCTRGRADDELFPTAQSQYRFRRAAVRYRYRRLKQDLMKLPASRWAKELHTIARCVGSRRSLAELLRHLPAPPTDLKQPPLRSMADCPSTALRPVLESTPGWSFWKSSKPSQLETREFSAPQSNISPCELPSIIELRHQLAATYAPGTLAIVADFDNRLVLWPLRRLLAEASCLVVNQPNLNTWYGRVLHEALLHVAPGATVELRLKDNVHLSGFGVKAEIDRIFPGQFKWAQQDSFGKHFHILRYTRQGPPHPAYSAPHTGWTFGVLTTGKRIDYVKRLLESIKRLCPTPWELVLVAPHPLELDDDARIRTIVFTEADDRGWITRKKNLIAAEARYSDLLICHDRFWLDDSFFEDFVQWGFTYGIAAPRVRLPNGRRGLDWAVVSSRNLTWSTGALLPYLTPSRYAYNPGGATLIRTEFWQDFPWNENLFWNEHEDVELCRRVQEAGHPIRLAASSVVAAEDRWIDENPTLPYRDDTEVLYGCPVSEQRILFLGSRRLLRALKTRRN